MTEDNIFVFGVKPTMPSTEFGYFLTKKLSKNIDRVSMFVEKPKRLAAKRIIKKRLLEFRYFFFARKDSIINNYKLFQSNIYKKCLISFNKARLKKNIYFLNKTSFSKISSLSFDKAILEKTKKLTQLN